MESPKQKFTTRFFRRSKRSLKSYLERFKTVFSSKNLLRPSFSQEGEDMVLFGLSKFRGICDGFYVDVGAHHPFRFSNTAFYYNLGWTGVNIDATPGSMDLFKKMRPRDTNIECAVSTEKGKKTFNLFKEPAYNGLSQARSGGDVLSKTFSLGSVEVESLPLSEILKRHILTLPKNNFLSVDAEGHDFDVLKSNNWEQFHFDWVLAELGGWTVSSIESNEIYKFMSSKGYSLCALTKRTAFFKSEK